MNPKIAEIVVTHPLFSTLSKEELAQIITLARLNRYPKNSFLTLAGDLWPYLFFILEGKVAAVKESSEGRSLLISTFESGEVFWGRAFFHEHATMAANLQVFENSQILLWERESLSPFFIQDGRFAWELCRLMASQMVRISGIVESLAFQPVAGRVARFLLEQSSPEQDVTPRTLTLDEIAARIGTTREVVCRYLRNFSENGLIDITRTEYNITDREGLARLTLLVKG